MISIKYALFFRLGREIERIALGLAEFGRLLRLRFSDVAREHGDDAGALPMRREHHVHGGGLVHAKHRLEHEHDELARREVVIEQNDLVELRPLRFRFRLRARLDGDLAHRASKGTRSGGPKKTPPNEPKK